MHHAIPSRKRVLATLITAIGLSATLSAQAGITSYLTVEGSASVNSGTPETYGPSTNPTYINGYVSPSDGSSNSSASSFGKTIGNSTAYAASAGGSGIFDATGKFQKTLTIDNDTGIAQLYTLSYYIYGGSFNVDGASGDSGASGYQYVINDGSSDLFASSALLELMTDGNLNLTRSGTELGTYTSGQDYYYTNSRTGTLNVGVLNPGESRTLTYSLISTAYGNFSAQDCGNGYGYGGDDGYGDGYGIASVAIVEEQCIGGAYAFLGDPDDVNATPRFPLSVTAQPANVVPLPGTLALLGLGLAGLGLTRKRPRA